MELSTLYLNGIYGLKRTVLDTSRASNSEANLVTSAVSSASFHSRGFIITSFFIEHFDLAIIDSFMYVILFLNISL